MRGRGRPPVGDRVEVRLTDAALRRIDELAERHQVKRAEMIRRLIDEALERSS